MSVWPLVTSELCSPTIFFFFLWNFSVQASRSYPSFMIKCSSYLLEAGSVSEEPLGRFRPARLLLAAAELFSGDPSLLGHRYRSTTPWRSDVEGQWAGRHCGIFSLSRHDNILSYGQFIDKFSASPSISNCWGGEQFYLFLNNLWPTRQ